MFDLNTALENGCTRESGQGVICIQNKENDVDVSLKNYIDALENKLEKAVVHDDTEAYNLYCDYAYVKGFSVRKGRHDFFPGTSMMRAKLFTCCKEGFKNLVNRRKCSYSRPNGRMGCSARIWFTRERNGLFKVTKWVKEHNHEMARPEHRHLLRSSRSINQVTGNLIESHMNAGLRPIDSFNIVAEDCGGVRAAGFTKSDLYNYIHLLKASKIEAGDSQSVINHFKKKSNEEGLFYWDVQLDDEGRVANVFWRDSRARIDYEFFGDVVTFDTTYRTNKYGLICAPFVGVNHHFQNVMFGCGFLSDETISSFKWLFETFLESMGGKQPKTIFTDQDAAMLNVIPTVFIDSKHRLCQWHISQNAPSHLGNLQIQPGFMNMWYKCMKGCDSEIEFEATWSDMMSNYNVGQHSWLNKMYELRHKWSTAFSKDTFYADLKSTSRSESTNRALNGIADRTTCLHTFVESFEKLVNKWRENEGDEDHFSNQGVPTLSIQSSQILKQASQKYTHTIYNMFEYGFMEGVGASDFISERQISTFVSCFEVELHENHKVSHVMFDACSMDIKCSCCRFETMGLLCPHAFRVITLKNVHALPEKYFLKRWCRDARDRVQRSSELQSHGNVSSESEMVYSNRLMRIAHEHEMQSKGHPELMLIFDKAMEDVTAKFKAFFQGHKSSDASKEVFTVNETQVDENNASIKDPLFVRSKGVSNKRIRRHWDKRQKRPQTVAKGTSTRRKKNADSSALILQDISNVMPMASQEYGFLHMQPSVMRWGVEPNLTLDGLSRGVQSSTANDPFALETYRSNF